MSSPGISGCRERLLALLVGGSLAVAGAVMQGVTRNPLAGPSIMGLSGGGSLASLIALIAVPDLSYNGAIAASFLGAVLGYGCVLAVACLSPDGFSPTRMALAGAVTSAFFSAITQGLVIAFAMTSSMLYWTIGGIVNVSWSQVVAVLPVCVLGLLGRVLDVTQHHDPQPRQRRGRRSSGNARAWFASRRRCVSCC